MTTEIFPWDIQYLLLISIFFKENRLSEFLLQEVMRRILCAAWLRLSSESSLFYLWRVFIQFQTLFLIFTSSNYRVLLTEDKIAIQKSSHCCTHTLIKTERELYLMALLMCCFHFRLFFEICLSENWNAFLMRCGCCKGWSRQIKLLKISVYHNLIAQKHLSL